MKLLCVTMLCVVSIKVSIAAPPLQPLGYLARYIRLPGPPSAASTPHYHEAWLLDSVFNLEDPFRQEQKKWMPLEPNEIVALRATLKCPPLSKICVQDRTYRGPEKCVEDSTCRRPTDLCCPDICVPQSKICKAANKIN